MDDQFVRMGGISLVCPNTEISEPARQRHLAGRLSEAAAVYQEILASDATNADALHRLGLVHHLRGDHASAAELIGRAVVLRPEFVTARNHLGVALHALGRLDDALEHFRRVVELEPEHALGRVELAQVLLSLGRPEEALPHCEEAVRLQPDLAAFHDMLGTVLRELRRLEEAKAVYSRAIELDPSLAAAHANLGLVLIRQNQIEAGRRMLVRAVDLNPDEPLFWQHLAELYDWLELFDAAITCWKRVLALIPEDRASPHLALGQALKAVNRLDEAETQYRIAAAIEPDSAPAQVLLGALDQVWGRFAEAEAAFRTAIRFQPNYAPAHARLANLLGGALPDPDLEALEAQVGAATNSKAECRARMLFALGHVLDARGEYAHAARCLREANALNLALFSDHHRFQPAEHVRRIGGLIRACNPEFFARNAGAGLDTRRPVFIIGLPRSGTTLLEQVLAGHPRIHGAGELLLGRTLFGSLPGVLNCSERPEDCVALLGPAQIRFLANGYWQQLGAVTGNGADRIVDKMPENFLYLGLLTVLFPGASIVHCRRCLPDVALSCWMTDFRSAGWASDSGDIALYFRTYLEIMNHWRDVLPATIHDVEYEETVSDLEGTARRVLAALGLEWDPACLEFHHHRRPIRTASNIQVRSPLHQNSVARWKHYEHELADLFAALPTAPGPSPGIDSERSSRVVSIARSG